MTVWKSFYRQSAVGLLIWCILDYAQRHRVDCWKKRPANFNFIWLEWNSYNSSIQIYIVWSRTSIFKLKSSPAQGCKYIQLRDCKNSCSERLLLQSMASNKNACNLRMEGYISNILFIILSLRNVTGNLSQYYLSIIQETDRSIFSFHRSPFGITL